MKDYKLILNGVKRLLGQEVNLEQMPLDNGTVIEADAFEAGSPVFIVTEDGQVPLPVGDYTLEDGRVLVVVEEGVISEMKDAEAPAAEAEVEVEAAEEIAPEVIAEEVVVAIEEVQTQVVSQVADIINEATPTEVTTEDSVTIAEDVIAEIISVVEANVPTAMMAQLKANLNSKKKNRVKKSEMAAMPAAKAIKPNPERESKKADNFKFSNNKKDTLRDKMMAKFSNINIS